MKPDMAIRVTVGIPTTASIFKSKQALLVCRSSNISFIIFLFSPTSADRLETLDDLDRRVPPST
jgi:hypothetical protein